MVQEHIAKTDSLVGMGINVAAQKFLTQLETADKTLAGGAGNDDEQTNSGKQQLSPLGHAINRM